MANASLPLSPGRVSSSAWADAVAWDHRQPYFLDAGLAGVLAGLSVPWVVLHTSSAPAPWLFTSALLLPLAWRRRYPVGVLVVLAAVALLQWAVATPLLADVALLAALFTVALERPVATALGAAAVVELGSIMASVRWSLAASWDRSLVGLTGLTAASLLLGAVLRARRAHLRELTERAARLEMERDQQAQIAAAGERTRIAREMHDVIAHSLAVIVTMADGAAAKLPRDPATAADAVCAISEVGRQALAETRRLLGVLRDRSDSPDMAPQPGLEGIDDLVHKLRSTGINTSVSYRGQIFDLAPGAELTIYRLVQEAATNTLKHAEGATSLHVDLDFDRPTVHIGVTDDGKARTPPIPGGHGLAGMRERVALYHGRIAAGPRPGGGWVVRATLDRVARGS